MLAMANHAAPVYHVRHLNLPSLVLCWLSTAGRQDCNRGHGPLIHEILRAPAVQCTRLQTAVLGTVLTATGPLVKVDKAMRALTIDQLFNHRLPFFTWLSMDGDHFTIR